MKILCLAMAALAALASTGLAATRTMVFTRADIVPMALVERAQGDASIILPDFASSPVVIAFELPKDFKKNSIAKLALIVSGQPSNCNYAIGPLSVDRFRVGSQEASGDTPETMGLTPVVPGPTPAAGQDLVFKKVFRLAKPQGLAITGQKAGDIIAVRIRRDGNDPTDTCGSSLFVQGARLTYKTP
jgi:hypothetical protein